LDVGTLQKNEVLVGKVLGMVVVLGALVVAAVAGPDPNDLTGGGIAFVVPLANGEGSLAHDAVAVGAKPRNTSLRQNRDALRKLGVRALDFREGQDLVDLSDEAYGARALGAEDFRAHDPAPHRLVQHH